VDRPLSRLLDGIVDSVLVFGDDVMVSNPQIVTGILSGSFNPLHDGHIRMVETVQRKFAIPVIYELSINNADKKSLDITQIQSRLRQFAQNNRRILLSREPFFYGKSNIFKNSIFVIGYDTAVRIVDLKYHQNDYTFLEKALNTIRENGCKFIVAGRWADNKFNTLADITIPKGYENLFDALPESDFRLDISSTQLRQNLN